MDFTEDEIALFMRKVIELGKSPITVPVSSGAQAQAVGSTSPIDLESEALEVVSTQKSSVSKTGQSTEKYSSCGVADQEEECQVYQGTG